LSLVLTSGGRTLKLGKVLGRGGEGTVHHVDGDAGIAVKIYTDGKAAERRDKIGTLVAGGYHRLSSFVAFPVEMVLGPNGDFIGFTMRKVAGFKPVHELYAPGSRKVEFPKADFRFLVRAAANVARAVASIHGTGCVIGDINHSGILVSEQATVTLIDSDSFQVRSDTLVYRCRVGVGEYTPPELQGRPLETVDRVPAHDAFGLAVILFQLLFMGRHPFAGRYNGPGDMGPSKRGASPTAPGRPRRGWSRPPSFPALPTLPQLRPARSRRRSRPIQGCSSSGPVLPIGPASSREWKPI
jgi:DNA-binding helix-hairpin-helix protein with protein kinase domain